MADDKPIIIIKKKGGHGGHHGGAWKVAYADFVTAMMAFFMVMWLVNSADVTTKQNIASYFRKPGIFESGSGTPLLIGEAGILEDGYVPPHPEDTKQLYQGKSKEQLKEKSGTDSNNTGNKRVTYRGTEGKRDSVPDEDVSQRGFQAKEPDDIANDKEIPLSIVKSGGGESKDFGGGQTEDTKDKTKSGENLGQENKKSVGIAEEIKEPSKTGEKETQKVAEAEKQKAIEKKALDEAAEKIKQQIVSAPEMKDLLGIVDVKVEADGLSIEIMDTAKTSMFQSGSAQILPDAEAAFQKIAPVIGKLPNKIDIVGHTDSKAFGSRKGGYSNWELSSDRANAARRLLEKNGIVAERFASVMGRADKELKAPTDPMAPANRRITLKLRFTTITPPIEAAESVADIKSRESVFQEEQHKPTITEPVASEPTAAPLAAKPTSKPFDAKEIIDANKSIRKPRVKLPGDTPPTENPDYMPKDKIFGDSPVIGAKDPFANF